jgi:phosphoribosyl-ATP pyrophosphohydrolase/phosphoribosyl-AMP cyclohydrolase
MEQLPTVNFDARGLVPVIAQDTRSGEVLMLAWANAEALSETLRSGQAHYYSRSRRELWRKGASSGNVQQVQEVRFDCDADALLYLVDQTGPACHTGEQSCFYRGVAPASLPAERHVPAPEQPEEEQGSKAAEAVQLLERVVAQRLRELPERSYITKLHGRGLGYMAQKVVEEAGETIVAALQQDDAELTGEAADLLFHLTVLLHERGLSLDAVAEVLLIRHHGKPLSGSRR